MAELLAPPWEPSLWLERLDVRSVDDFDAPEVVEDADSFAGNARKKAGELARALSAWVLADDSGLAVDALGVRPACCPPGTRESPPTTKPIIASCWTSPPI